MLKKQQAKQSLEKLVNRYQKNRPTYIDPKKHYNETQARLEYIDEFLEILGWDIDNKAGKNYSIQDVVVEERIDISNKPDYSLRRNGTTIVTVEAEKPSKDILKDRQPAHQVLRYGWHSGNDVGVLFNMERFEVYQTIEQPKSFDKSKPNSVIAPYVSISVDDFLDQFDLIWAFVARESIYGTEFDDKVATITPESATKTRLDASFLTELQEWRVLVGSDLIASNPDRYSNAYLLNQDAQTFLNQIIFLRYAEDNSLEPDKSVELVFDDPKSFEKHLHTLDKKYNSGIFADSSIAGSLSSGTIRTITSRLYYPNVAYDFSLIDLGILGRVYEQFLQSVLKVTNGRISLVPTETAAIIKSVVSTPQDLTKTIVQIALREKLEDLDDIEEVLKLTIADIAVGSGVFLIAAYDYIEGKLVDLLSKETKQAPRLDVVPFELKQRIVTSMLYGADIDEQAVQITKFSLALRLLRNERPARLKNVSPLLPDLHANVISHNSLITTTDAMAVLDGKTSLSEIEEMNPAEYESARTFDVIIGNPPYLSTEAMKGLHEIEYKIYISKFRSAYKQFDKYFLFIEQVLSQLSEGGKAVLVVPHKFTVVESGSKLRSLLESEGWVEDFIDFGTSQLFAGKDTYVAIISFSKNNEKIKYQTVTSIDEINFDENNEISYDDLHVDPNGPWLLSEQSSAVRLYKALAGNQPINNFVSIQNGIQTSSKLLLFKHKDVIEVSENTVKFRVKLDGKTESFEIEKGLLRPFFKNLDHRLKAYSTVKSDYWLIFPYDSGRVIAEEKLKSRYPLGYAYLVRIKNYLMPKSMGGKRDVPNAVEWYQFGRTQALNLDWEKRKLVVTNLTKRPSVAVDESGSMLASGGTAGYIPVFEKNEGGTTYSLNYVLGWLNQDVVDQMFLLISSDFNGDYWTHGTANMKRVPMLTIDFHNPDEYKLYTEINNAVANRLKSENSAMQKAFETQISKLFAELIKLRTGLTI